MVSTLNMLFIFVSIPHVFVLINLVKVSSGFKFKLCLALNVFLAAVSLWFLFNGISIIANVFSYFDIPLLEETSNIIARVLFGTVLVTGIISFFSLIFGPGRLYNNPK